MKRKFIEGVFLIAVSIVSLSTFTSCKDDDEAIRTEMNQKYVALKVELEKLQSTLSQCSSDCQQKISDLERRIQELENKTNPECKYDHDALITELNNLYVKKSEYDQTMLSLKWLIKANFSEQDVEVLKYLITLKGQLEEFFKAGGTLEQMQNSITTINNSITTINNSITTINNSLTSINDILNGNSGKGIIGLTEWFNGIGITPEQFQNYVKQGQYIITNKEALDYLIRLKNEGTLNEDALKALNGIYQNLSGINTMYETIFKGVETPEGGWWNYAEVMQKIKDNTAAIEALKTDVDKLLNRFNDLVTGLVLQATSNPVFGGLSTPFGLNSLVLMACYGERTTEVDVFPISGRGAECNNTKIDNIDWSAYTSDNVSLGKFIVDLDENEQAKLGNLWFTVNPGTVNNLDLNGFALVNSRDDDPIVTLSNITKDDETVLKFGMTSRAAGNGNGLYKTNVTCDPQKLADIKVHIEANLVEALKNAVRNHTASDMVTLARTVVRQLHDVCDANALRYSYEAYTSKNADGTWNKSAQKVYSQYGLAATAFKPLSFATLQGSSSFGHIPTISPIEIPRDRVNLDLGTFSINSKNFKLTLNFGKPHFDNIGNLIVKTTVTLKDNNGNPVTGDVEINITNQAKEIQQNVVDAINEWLDAEGGLDARVEKAIWQALFNGTNESNPKFAYDPSLPKGIIVDLLDQVDEMTGKIQNKLYDLVDEINRDYLGKVNTLINKYNTVAERINNVLSDPNHYLQVTMLYRKAGKLALNGHTPEVDLPFGLLSTNPNQPTQFRGAGEAISLWATTYNFEVLCPAFKKMVAVTKVTDSKGNVRNDLMKAANKTLAKVMNGDRNRVALDVSGATNGTYTYEIAYQAVDYSGYTSTVKCYVQVVR